MANLVYEPVSVDGPVKDVQPRILRAPFGDGYSQRVADGINYIDETWNLNWDHADLTEAAALEAQFEGLAGDTLDWTPPNESASKKFTVTKWKVVHKIGTVYNYAVVSATLVREYDL